MLNSGLLSLSIHEALTFDDTEIALSPDLFIDNIIHNTGSVSTVLTNGSRQVALGGRGVTGAQNGGATRSQSSKQHQSSDPSLTTASVATEQHAHHHESTTTIGSNVSHRKLDVGDMIEIKVWDPHNIRSSPPPSQILSQRKRPTPSSDDPASTPTVTPTQQFDQRKHSLPTSSDLRKNTPVEPTGGETSTVSSPTNPPKAPPPPPPHSNPISPGNNSENNHLDNTKPPRPPRRGGTPKATPRMVVNPTKPSRHFRDISDMTMDTDVGDLLAHASMDSHDLVLPSGEQLNHMSKISSTHTLRLSFVMMVGEKTLTSLKGNSRSQVSMLRQVADLYNLSPYDMVTVHKIDKEEEPHVLKQVSADFVTVTIKDQFISRGEMHFFQASLIGRWIYEGERLISLNKIKAHAREIRHKNRSAKSGIVTNDTKITFRSRSARFVWLVQLSCEMWDYASPASNSCELYFDKFVNFMYKLFRKWKELEVTHSLTVIFFSRTLILDPSSKKGPLKRDVYGRYYEDHFKTIIGNETTPDWHALVVRMKRAFVNYPIELGWKEGKRRPSTAMQGNVLEAINVALNLLQFHYLDRDLYRTGNSIVVVSPDCGVFEVDKGLAGITYQRMMDNGIGSDMLCLGLPPLHVAPFFLYNVSSYNASIGANLSFIYLNRCSSLEE